MRYPKIFKGSAALVALPIGLVFLLLLAAGVRRSWQLHFWFPEGRAILLGEWQFDDYEFQVWQRKTRYFFEPFADGFFVRSSTNEWQVFCFDIEDKYLPKVELRKSGTTIEVIRFGTNCGMFDMSDNTFRRTSNGPVAMPGGIGKANQPPGQWWLRKTN